ncbi:FxLYD domain-containing protein [Tissierella sp.]|uniref:FxLYD domain-containing protein n=1 Tax=Tissierella sp. TaxID=41274 RepID=UPI0028AEFD4E|nr:FxLYD domain-containing protein [Tissierella sp.]
MSTDKGRFKKNDILYKYEQLNRFQKLVVNILLIVIIITPIIFRARLHSIKTLEKSIISKVENLAKEESYNLTDAVPTITYNGIWDSGYGKYRRYKLTVFSSDFEKLNNDSKYSFIDALDGIKGKTIVSGEVISDDNVYKVSSGILEKNDEEHYVTVAKAKERKEQEKQKEIEDNRKNPFEFEGVKMTVSGNYIYYTGYVKNISDLKFFYIKVKATYYDENKDVIDTDWTYAVGSEGLSPNDRKSFEIMTKYNESVTQGSLSVLDYE